MKKWIALALMVSGTLIAQQRPAFDVASVKSMGLVKAPPNMTINPGGITFTNVTALDCIVAAYSLKEHQVIGPDWLKSDRYEIVARTNAPATDPQLKQMLQSLMADRFKMAVHHETKDLAIYAITESKNGTKLRKAGGGGRENSISFQGTKLAFRNYSMAGLVKFLSSLPNMDRPISDATELKDSYDFEIAVDAAEVEPDAVKRALLDWATLFVDLDRQVGLRVEARKAPADVLIVDHIEQPAANPNDPE